jgi:hypothetical protein
VKYLPSVSLILTLLLVASSVHAQKTTEIFIPIDQSPGLSGTQTLIATIDSVNVQNRTLTLRDSSGTHTVRLADETQIFLDRSRLRSPNRKGTIADLGKDRLAEVKYKNNDRNAGLAEWIKVQITE